jgi:hypothetical protein
MSRSPMSTKTRSGWSLRARAIPSRHVAPAHVAPEESERHNEDVAPVVVILDDRDSARALHRSVRASACALPDDGPSLPDGSEPPASTLHTTARRMPMRRGMVFACADRRTLATTLRTRPSENKEKEAGGEARIGSTG